MKAKLLKKVRRRVKLFKRNSIYIVKGPELRSEFKYENEALRYYRSSILYEAKYIFGFKPKKRLR